MLQNPQLPLSGPFHLIYRSMSQPTSAVKPLLDMGEEAECCQCNAKFTVSSDEIYSALGLCEACITALNSSGDTATNEEDQDPDIPFDLPSCVDRGKEENGEAETEVAVRRLFSDVQEGDAVDAATIQSDDSKADEDFVRRCSVCEVVVPVLEDHYGGTQLILCQNCMDCATMTSQKSSDESRHSDKLLADDSKADEDFVRRCSVCEVVVPVLEDHYGGTQLILCQNCMDCATMTSQKSSDESRHSDKLLAAMFERFKNDENGRVQVDRQCFELWWPKLVQEAPMKASDGLLTYICKNSKLQRINVMVHAAPLSAVVRKRGEVLVAIYSIITSLSILTPSSCCVCVTQVMRSKAFGFRAQVFDVRMIEAHWLVGSV